MALRPSLRLTIWPLTVNAEPQPLIIGVEKQDSPPYHRLENEQYQSFFHEVLDIFAQQYGYQADYRMLTIKDLYIALRESSIDIQFPDNPYWQHRNEKELTYRLQFATD